MMIDAKKIKQHLSPSLLSQVTIECLDTIDSTNTYLKKFAKQCAVATREFPYYLCVADQQTAGRGRDDKSWYSPPADNIYFSLLAHCQQPPQQLAGLSVQVGESLLAMLSSLVPTSGWALKFPNDLMYQGKKLGGILVETVNNQSHRCDVVVGVGLNVNLQEDKSLINQPWVSLKSITNIHYERELIMAMLLRALLRGL